MLTRLKSLWLVIRMRPEGLPETLETLREIREFYRVRAAYKPVQVEPLIEKITVRMGKTYVRPEFPIDESEV